MERKATLAVAVSFVLGAVAFHLYLTRLESEIAGGAPQEVLIAARDVALGESLTRSLLTIRKVPETYVDERQIRGLDVDRVLGARVTSALGAGGVLLWSDLDTMQAGRTLSGLVRVGMRAFSLAAQDVSFDGLLRPGDRVDVVYASGAPGASATALLSNVLVLTVGADLGQQEQEPGAVRTKGRVTLSVSPEQAAILASREGTGRFRLALRNPEDVVVSDLGQTTYESASAHGEPRHAR